MVYALIIDDDQALSESVQRTANLAGLQLLAASTWDEGLNLFQVHSPELVIVDYNLPGSKHGLKLITEIRRLRPAVRLILVSAYIDEQDVAEIEATGLVDRALSKITSPHPFQTLLEEIREASGRAKEPTDWVAVANAYQRAESVDHHAIDDLDQRIQSRRGVG